MRDSRSGGYYDILMVYLIKETHMYEFMLPRELPESNSLSIGVLYAELHNLMRQYNSKSKGIVVVVVWTTTLKFRFKILSVLGIMLIFTNRSHVSL